MAIIRCPYCHAIIDETAKYCNNCGTQLLFPDDEILEEEIPGEKILHADVEEKDYELNEPEDETINLKEEGDDQGVTEEDVVEDKEVQLDDDLNDDEWKGDVGQAEPEEEEIRTRDLEGDAPEETEEEEAPPEEMAGVDEEAEGEPETGESEPPRELEETEMASPEEEGEEEEIALEAGPDGPGQEEEPESAADLGAAEVEYIKDAGETDEPAVSAKPATPPPDEDETATVEVAAKSEDTFDTRDLDKIGKTVDLGKEKVDRFLEIMAEKEKEAREEGGGDQAPRPPDKTDTGGTLPPWADAMVGVPSFESGEKTDSFPPEWQDKELPADDTSVEAEEAGEEPPEEKTERILPRRRASDSGIGFPERLTQPILPFGEARGEGEAEEEESAAAREPVLPRRRRRGGPEFLAPAAAGLEADKTLPPFNLVEFAKAKVFDCLFVAVFWLVTSWFASRSLGGTLFRLFASAGGLLLAFYLTLLVMYFFLFQFFIGETLGDRVFRKKG